MRSFWEYPYWHLTDQYRLQTSTDYRPVQATEQTSTGYRPVQATDQYRLQTSTDYRPVQTTDQYRPKAIAMVGGRGLVGIQLVTI